MGEGDGYSLVDTGHDIGGGVGPTQGPDAPGGITVYVKVDDLQAYHDKAEKLGGATVVPPTELPGDFGSFAVFADPRRLVEAEAGVDGHVADTG